MSKETEKDEEVGKLFAMSAIDAILSDIERVTIITNAKHWDIRIDFHYAMVPQLFDMLIKSGLQATLINKKGEELISKKDLQIIEKCKEKNSLFVSFSTRIVRRFSTIVCSYVGVEAGYKLKFSHPDDETVKEFPIMPSF